MKGKMESPKKKEIRLKGRTVKTIIVDLLTIPDGFDVAKWLEVINEFGVCVYNGSTGNKPEIHYHKRYTVKDLGNSKVFR